MSTLKRICIDILLQYYLNDSDPVSVCQIYDKYIYMLTYNVKIKIINSKVQPLVIGP